MTGDTKSKQNLDQNSETSGAGTSTSNPELNNQAEISKVSVRAPPFWRANPALWFCQLEAQFEINRITSDKSRYYAVVAAIESTVLHQVSDLVLNPPQNNLYAGLKARLLDVFAESEQSRLKKLLGELELRDQKPSYLLREMKNLAGQSISAEILKTLWLQRLPTSIQAILAVSSEDLDHLTVMADKIFETSAGSEIHKINTKPNDNTSLESQVANLTRQISEMRSEFSRHGTNNRNSSNRSRSRSKTPHNNSQRNQSKHALSSNTKLCWYHHKWGNKAKICAGHCDFEANQSNSKN